MLQKKLCNYVASLLYHIIKKKASVLNNPAAERGGTNRARHGSGKGREVCSEDLTSRFLAPLVRGCAAQSRRKEKRLPENPTAADELFLLFTAPQHKR